MVLSCAHEGLVSDARKVVSDTVNEAMLQITGATVLFTQFDGHVDQHAFNEDALSRGLYVADRLVRIVLSPQIIGFVAFAGVNGPEVDCCGGWAVVEAVEGAERWQIVQPFDDERLRGSVVMTHNHDGSPQDRSVLLMV